MANPIRKLWLAADIKKLRMEYPHRNTAVLAQEMGRTVAAVRARAELSGITKERRHAREAFLDTILSEYASNPASAIARARGVEECTVRMWLREARYGIGARGEAV